MKKIKVNFKLKGERNYVHGTDIFNNVISKFPDHKPTRIKLFLHDFILSTVCELVFYDKNPESLNGSVHGVLNIDGQEKWFEFIELDSKHDIVQRVDYPEIKITNSCEIEEQSIKLNEKSMFTFVETIVSMKKYLLNNILPCESGKWVLTRLDLDVYKDIRDNLKIEVTHNFQNKLIRSSILYNEKKIGNMYFSWVKK